jgi:hypothetical protein
VGVFQTPACTAPKAVGRDTLFVEDGGVVRETGEGAGWGWAAGYNRAGYFHPKTRPVELAAGGGSEAAPGLGPLCGVDLGEPWQMALFGSMRRRPWSRLTISCRASTVGRRSGLPLVSAYEGSRKIFRVPGRCPPSVKWCAGWHPALPAMCIVAH